VRVLHAFLPLLAPRPAPVVVNLSSGLASADPGSGHPRRTSTRASLPASKTAVNMVTVAVREGVPEHAINARARFHPRPT